MPEGAVDVRLATEAELEAVTALLVAQLREHHVTTPEAKLASAIEAVLRHPERGRILVAIERGRPVGMAALSFVWPLEHGGRSAWLEELYVEPAARGRGLGTQLLHAALRIAAETGAVAVDLEVDADHQRAARLYAREGFRPLARARWVRTLEPAAEPRAAAPAAAITGGCFCGAIRYRVSATSGGEAARELPRFARPSSRGPGAALRAGVYFLDHPAQDGIHRGRLVRPARVHELLGVMIHLDAAFGTHHRSRFRRHPSATPVRRARGRGAGCAPSTRAPSGTCRCAGDRPDRAAPRPRRRRSARRRS